jgi:hypothetical protein
MAAHSQKAIFNRLSTDQAKGVSQVVLDLS